MSARIVRTGILVAGLRVLRKGLRRLRRNPGFWMSLLVIAFLLALPYWIFEGRLFIGGDDSRLFYVYPWEFLREYGWSSWFHFSSVGMENPNTFLLPLLGILGLLKLVVASPVVFSYLAFSAPFILGYLFFIRLVREVVVVGENYRWEILLGGLVYILSPIMIINQWSVFLYAVWLVAMLPLSLYYFIRFWRTGSFRYVVIHAVWLVVFSLAFFSIPWVLGIMIPLTAGVVVGLVRAGRTTALRFVKRAGIFYGFAAALQSFWIVPMLVSLLSPEEASFTGQSLSAETGGTFSDTVNATSRGTVIYPLLNLFHRQVAFDFDWELREVYTALYDQTWPLNLVLLGVIVAGILLVRQMHRRERRIFGPAVVALGVALLFFTVNVGPFKQFFLWLGSVPGFVMFRNAYDKFALGYVFLYAAVFTLSLVTVSRVLRQRLRITLLVLVGAAIVVGALPIKQLVDKPLWLTNTGTTTILPAEYTDFMKGVKRRVPETANILSVPLGVTTYSIVKEESSDRVYAGRSPVSLLSGRNDFSGTGSFLPSLQPVVGEMLRSGDYQSLRNLLLSHNVGYILETRNIPPSVRKSYLFKREELEQQQGRFREALFGVPVVSSRNKHYVLYKLKGSSKQTLVTTPSVQYDPPDLFSEAGEAAELFAFVDPENVLLDGTPHQPSVTTLLPIESDRPLTLDRGDYRLFEPSGKDYLLWYDEQFGEVLLERKPAYEINGVRAESKRQLLTTLTDPETVVMVGNEIHEAEQLDGVRVGPADTIRVYQPEDRDLVGDLAEFFTEGSKLDCNAYDEQLATDHNFAAASGELTLVAQANHDACLYRDLSAFPDTLYRLSFEYRADAENVNLQVYGGKGRSQLLDETLPTVEGGWQSIQRVFKTKNHRTVRPYLYSGQAAVEAVTSYRNVALQPLRPVETIKVGQHLGDTGAGETSIPVTQRGTLTFHFPVLDLPEDSRDLRRWERGDCRAIDSHHKTGFQEIDNVLGMKLIAQGGHEACIYQDIPLMTRGRHTVQFDYYTDSGQEVRLHVDYPGRTKVTEVELPSWPGKWQSFSSDLAVPAGARLMNIYLYSGQNQAGTAVARYRNFRLKSVPDPFLLKETTDPIVPPKSTEVKKLSQTSYRVTFRGVREDFLSQFSEAHHRGWDVYPGNTDRWYEFLWQHPLTLSHYQANRYSNAWWIEVDMVCQRSGACQRNSDGTHDLTLILHFSPQRYVYLGILLSIVAAGVGLLYWRRRGR